MKRYIVRLAVLVAIVLILGMGYSLGLTRAATTERAPSAQSASSAPTPTPPVPSNAGVGPSSGPGAQPATGVYPTIVESPPVITAAAAGGAAFFPNRSLRYAGSVFKPRENDVNYKVTGIVPDVKAGGCVYVDTGSIDVTEVWNVPLVLPQDAQVQVLRMFFYDNDPANVIHGYFTVYDPWGYVVQEAHVDSVDGGYNYADVELAPAQTIDYTQYSYVINWQRTLNAPTIPGENLQLCGFRLFYYQPLATYFPAVRK